MKDKKEKPICMSLGMLLGTVVSTFTDNFVCIPIGLLLGLCIGAILDARKGKEDTE